MAAKIVVVFDFDKTIIDLDSDNCVVDELGFTDLFNQHILFSPANSPADLIVYHHSTLGNRDNGKKVKEVNLFVLYNGTWKNNDNKWTFEGACYTVISIHNRVTLEELLNQLYTTLSVDKSAWNLKLEAAYACGGQTLPPLSIVDDNGVSCYIRETTIYVQHRTPLCVTVIAKDLTVVPSSSNIVKDHSDSFVPKTTLDGEASGYPYQPYQQSYVIQPDLLQPEFIETTPVHTTYLNQVHTGVFQSGLKQETCFDQQTYQPFVNKPPMLDLNAPPEDNEEDIAPPHAELKNVRVKGFDDINNFFRLPTFTADDVAGGSGPVDIASNVSTGELYVGQVFDNKKELKKAAALYAIGENFEFVVDKSGTDVFYIVCKDPNCRWRLRGKLIDLTNMFRVTTFFNVHTCKADTHGKDHRQATPWIVADLIKNKIVEDGPKYLPRHIITDMKQDYGFEMTYEKAWRCKEAALNVVRGTPEASYAILPSYLYMLQMKNPYTVQDFVSDDDGAFKYCFFSLGASRRGFMSCRRVICVDGTFLKCRFGGILLCAVALDAENRLFPLGVAIVDSENNDSWLYFMNMLKVTIGDVEGLVFVSDRHQSIANALQLVFPDAYHGACYYHIKQNVHAKFKHDLCDADMFAAAYAYRRSVFERHFMNIQSRDPRIAAYLEEIGKHKWARSYFPGNRYNIMTSNYAESLNNTTKEARTWPVTSLLEFIRFKLQLWFFKRREAADSSIDSLSPMREKTIRQLCDQARYLRANPINKNEVQVLDGQDDVVVNLDTKECTCGEFQIDRMPCVHAVATSKKKRNVSIYDLCSTYYTIQSLRNTYADSIYPCGKEDDWNVPDLLRSMHVGVPVPRATIGRPKKKQGRPKYKRITSQGERIAAERRCSRCRDIGHNRVRCTVVL